MLRILPKTEYWAAEDAGMLSRTRFDPTHFTIKSIQDAVLMIRLDGVSDLDILEVGGGHSRVLDYFCERNRCTNIDPLEGYHGGPTGQRSGIKYKQIYGEIGKTSGTLEANAFDLVFSISVVEHVLEADLDAFFADIARILRPGGRMLHLIDTYLGVDPDVNAEALARFRSYRRVFDSGLFRPLDATAVAEEKEICFHPSMASNPDNIMNEWNHAAPSLRELRARAQATTYVMDGLKA